MTDVTLGDPRSRTAAHPLTPRAHRVVDVRRETADVVTVDLVPVDGEPLDLDSGQFCMVYAFGVGEAPISVSGTVDDEGVLRHTIRRAGLVTRALCDVRPGEVVGIRGPYGRGWPTQLDGAEVLVVGGGIGLAPLRPLIRSALRTASHVAVAIGARQPADLLFGSEPDEWADRGASVVRTVDVAPEGWRGEVGFVTDPALRLVRDPRRTIACVCGPEPMMRAVARRLVDLGVDADHVFVSVERNMHCAVGHCGRCQLGPVLVCRDGPVLPWSEIAGPVAVRSW